MNKLRVKNRYATIPNEVLNNSQLSLKAKGLFAFIQGKPDGWLFSTERIASQMKDGVDSVRGTLQELETHKYLIRTPKKNSGKFKGYDYVLLEKPSSENPTTEKPTSGNPHTLSKKESSKKDIVKKTTINSKTSFAGKEINQCIDLFKEINPSYERFFSNKTQRGAVERIFKKFGYKNFKKFIKASGEILGVEYAPQITTPLQLENKLALLFAYFKKEQNKTNRVIEI